MFRWVRQSGILAASAGLVCACASQPASTVSVVAPPPAASRTVPPPAPAAPKTNAPVAASPEEEAAEEDTEPSSPIASSRGWLGVELEATGPDEAGVRVLRVVPKSPAASAGIRAGDVIVRLDNDTVSAPADVVRWISQRPATSRVSVMVKRQRQDRLFGVTLGAFPEGDALVRMTFVGQPAPLFEQLEPAQGSPAPTLLAHRGKVVLLEFWAPWCVACRALIPHMNQWHEQYGARGLNVIGITNERVARASLVARQLGMEFPVLADPSGKTTQNYQARAIPMVFVVDRQGTVRDVMVGYDSRKLAELDVLVEKLVNEP